MGTGAAAIYNLMEDAATAEISRSQIWQWLRQSVTLEGGQVVTKELILKLENEEVENIKTYVGEQRFQNGKFGLAISLFNDMIFSKEFDEFLSIKAYPYLD